MRNQVLWVGVAVCALWSSSSVLAGEAEDILKRVDKGMSQAKDQVSVMKMTLEDADGKTKVRELSVQQKGSSLRMMKFLKPADVKGVGFLVLSEEEMYLYMPEFGKVRRIASHMKNDNFMGTDFSYSDLGSSDYSADNTAKVLKKDATSATLELVPKKGSDSPYGKLEMEVDLTRDVFTTIRFFDAKGVLWKEMRAENVEKVGGYTVARKMTMRDQRKKHATVIEMTELKFDTGLSDKDFSTRKLKRSR